MMNASPLGNRGLRARTSKPPIKFHEGEQPESQQVSQRQRLTWWIAAEVIVVAALLGFLIVRLVVTAPNRQLVKDLDLLENLDAYRHAEDVEFLRSLEREGLFSVESEDDL